jgi:hypothetical protein
MSEGEKLIPNIEEMKKYSMSVIYQELPDVRDGLQEEYF